MPRLSAGPRNQSSARCCPRNQRDFDFPSRACRVESVSAGGCSCVHVVCWRCTCVEDMVLIYCEGACIQLITFLKRSTIGAVWSRPPRQLWTRNSIASGIVAKNFAPFSSCGLLCICAHSHFSDLCLTKKCLNNKTSTKEILPSRVTI